MTSVKTLDRGPDPESPDRFGRLTPLAWSAIIVGVASLVHAALNSSRSVAGPRVGRPEGSFVPSRTAFLGISNWYLYFEIGSLVMFFAVWGTAIVQSRRRGKPTPTLLMIGVTTSLTWLRPILNWAPYASYGPRVSRFRVDWCGINSGPSVAGWAVTSG